MAQPATLACALALLLAGCAAPPDPIPPDPISPAPISPGPTSPAPASPGPISPGPVPPPGGAAESPLARSYRAWGARLVAMGRLRTETDPADAPVTAAGLVRDFEQVALHTERGGPGGGPAPAPLSRWPGAIALRVTGATAADLGDIRTLARQLSRATGRAITVTAARDAPGPPAPGTLQVRFADAPARRALADSLAPRLGEGGRLVPALRADPPPSPCLFWPVLTGEGRISAALVVIAAETAGLVRLACIHEEVTQALGLFNDGPGVRPSLFNDDQEFALLTRHDAALLAMLYDTHLHPGQPASAVRPFLPAAADRALASGAAAIPSAD